MASAAPPRPLILDDADLLIDGQSLCCVLNHIELNPDVSVVTITTMCGETDYPGTVKWALLATLIQSFDPAATEEVLSAAVDGGVPVAFELIPRKSDPVSATNPKWTGELIPQPYSPVNGDAGSESTIDLEWSLTGPPVKSITDVIGLDVMDAARTADAPEGEPLATTATPARGRKG